MITVEQAADLGAILDARGDLMAAMSSPWLAGLAEVPEDAAPPLAMSGPHPRAVGSYGAECLGWLRREMGLTPRWWQALAITRQLEHDEAGDLVWREVVETGPRRIGKSVRLRGVALWRTDQAERIGERQLSMLVSKDLAVGKEIHRGAWRWAEEREWKVIRLGGAQEIEKTEDESRWLLRADTAVYGYDVGYGQVDESWGVDPQSITDGLEPALLERLWAQLHLTSTAHVKATSLMRRRLTAALRDSDPDVLLLMWGARPGADIGDEQTWREASPHWSQDRRDLMARKYAAALAGQDEPEFDDPDPMRGWAAQYLNVWPSLLAGPGDALVMPNWPLCVTTNARPAPERIGVAADPDLVWASIGASGGSGSVKHLGAVLRRRIDVDQALVVSEAKRIQDEHGVDIVVDKKGPAATLGRAIENAGGRVTWVGLDDYVASCAELFKAVSAKEVEHGDYDELNDAVRAAGKRKVGDRWAWARQGGDVSMLEAVTLAFGTDALYDPLDSIG